MAIFAVRLSKRFFTFNNAAAGASAQFFDEIEVHVFE
jgi:hypothetical protein